MRVRWAVGKQMDSVLPFDINNIMSLLFKTEMISFMAQDSCFESGRLKNIISLVN